MAIRSGTAHGGDAGRSEVGLDATPTNRSAQEKANSLAPST